MPCNWTDFLTKTVKVIMEVATSVYIALMGSFLTTLNTFSAHVAGGILIVVNTLQNRLGYKPPLHSCIEVFPLHAVPILLQVGQVGFKAANLGSLVPSLESIYPLEQALNKSKTGSKYTY